MGRIRQHQALEERLLFERSSPGKIGYQLPALDVPPVDPERALGSVHVREEIPGFPEVSEVEVIRHFTRLSSWNYAIDSGMYPLGSCTMKYNPRLNEAVARIDGIIDAHPYQPECLAQGMLEIQRTLEAYLAEICGMDAVTLQPAAGAHGELTGLLLIRAYLESRGDARRVVLIPDSAHGTNPATASIAGYEVVEIPSNRLGMIDLATLRDAVDDSVAALMVTNPNTVGIFEQDIAEVAAALHERGAQLYMDGANMNALVGIARPGDFGVDVMHLNLHKTFSTPHGGGGPGAGPVAVKRHLEPHLPLPRIRAAESGLSFDWDRPASIGRVRAFYGNFGVLVRALAYILAHGGDGLRNATVDAVLNANYIRKGLEGRYELPYEAPSMHECIFSDSRQAKHGVKTGDIAKRLIDYGFHPYTVSFPLIVRGALMIEPTETESKHELDEFIAAMRSIAEEAERDPDLIRRSPVTTRTSRVDETRAARKPILKWQSAGQE
ncbi:MAG: aminomethyl-transferring glycine dehydrogenase subunit GcvPB [Bryobacterales bacterium]|nr:aminomethyl-transferring glycine dehydrogenase subunit GcvPB [Bryobacterales bacterium]MDE0263794.1 aminomethyl-transferring glycine dehydrogenase subunit GcvPB [Bryobacterales bacterium]MDE0620479.1 aminomethyl-transferring glycine dehydrogenase subunit GcvPB [Bryobacterales bacterium]